jgi:hypothetical protein
MESTYLILASGTTGPNASLQIQNIARLAACGTSQE